MLINRCSRLKEEKYNNMKPPNIIIYADSPDAINNVKMLLQKVLDRDRCV